MSEVTVGSLAKVLGMPVEKLLEQLAGAGMSFSGPDQVVSSTEKMKLLGFLRRTHGKDDKPAEGAAPRKITLQRKQQSEIKLAGAAGRARTVNVEVRVKRDGNEYRMTFADGFSDVDLCLKAGQAGYLTVWTPLVQVLHTGELPQASEALQALREKWSGAFAQDPAYNANLSLQVPGGFAKASNAEVWSPLQS